MSEHATWLDAQLRRIRGEYGALTRGEVADEDPDQLVFLQEIKTLYVAITRCKRNLIFYESRQSMEASMFVLWLVNATERGLMRKYSDESLLLVVQTPLDIAEHLDGLCIRGDHHTRDKKALSLQQDGKFDEAEALYRMNGSLYKAVCSRLYGLMSHDDHQANDS